MADNVVVEDIGFAQNYTNLYFINITPGAASKTWARLGAGINSVTPAGNEVIDQANYYDGEGVADSEVTGGQPIFSFAGHRRLGDPAQDWIASKLIEYGGSRRTQFLWIEPNGGRLEGDCTVANLVTTGGDPNAKGTFSCEVHLNGRPSYTPGDKNEFPTEITAEAVTATTGTLAKIEPTVTPEGASDSVVFAVDNPAIATVDALGTVTPVKAGKCNVNIKSAVKPTVQTTVEVTVSAAQQSSLQQTGK